MGLIPGLAEVTARGQALTLGLLRLEAHSPNLSFRSRSLGTSVHPLSSWGCWVTAGSGFCYRPKKRTLVSVEGRSLDCTENIRGEAVSRADTTSPPPPEDRSAAQFQRGSLRPLLSQEAVAPSNLGAGRSLVAELSGPWDKWEQPDCGVLGRSLSIGWGESRGIPSQHPASRHTTPWGRPPAPPSSAPASQPAQRTQ